MQLRGNTESPKPKKETISIAWTEDPTSRHTSHLQIAVAECVETKTVTTTTTTKRSYPPMLIRQQTLETLDAKEYPLATQTTPSTLLNFSYENEVESKMAEQVPSHTRSSREKLVSHFLSAGPILDSSKLTLCRLRSPVHLPDPILPHMTKARTTMRI